MREEATVAREIPLGTAAYGGRMSRRLPPLRSPRPWGWLRWPGVAATSTKGDGKQAAEPATSPALTTTPAGTTRQVAPLPQGIVYDARTDSLVVAVRDPYRLLVLDPATLRGRQQVGLPGKVRHLQVTPWAVRCWCRARRPTRCSRSIWPPARCGPTDVQRHPHDAAGADDGDVLVGNEFSGSVSVVRRGRVVHTFSDLRQPGGVLASGTSRSRSTWPTTVTTYDLDTDKRVARVPGQEGEQRGVLVGAGRIAVADTRGDRVLLYTLDPLEPRSARSR